MNLLAIDTSTQQATLALWANGKMHTAAENVSKQHAQRILPLTESLFLQAQLPFSKLNGIVFGRGPGSFTGLRIACSVAKGLAYAQNLPLYPVSSLAAMAFAAQKKYASTPILAAMDARMKQVYWALFTDALLDVSEHVTCISEIDLPVHEPFVLAGCGLQQYRALLKPTLEKRLIAEVDISPRAENMIQIVQQGHIQAVSAAKASPVYVRNQVIQGVSHG